MQYARTSGLCSKQPSLEASAYLVRVPLVHSAPDVGVEVRGVESQREACQQEPAHPVGDNES